MLYLILGLPLACPRPGLELPRGKYKYNIMGGGGAVLRWVFRGREVPRSIPTTQSTLSVKTPSHLPNLLLPIQALLSGSAN